MGQQDLGRRTQDARERMSEIAEELARRTSPRYLRHRATEATKEKAMELRDRAVSSPPTAAIIGGVLGALLGSALARRQSRRGRHDEWVGGARRRGPSFDRYRAYEADEDVEREPAEAASGVEALKEKVADTTDRIKERVSEASGSVRERTSRLRERVPSVEEVRERAYLRWEERPFVFSLLALLAGAIFGLLLPVSGKERRLLAPVKQKAAEQVGSVGEAVERRLGERAGEPSRAAIPEAGGEAAAAPAGLQPDILRRPPT